MSWFVKTFPGIARGLSRPRVLLMWTRRVSFWSGWLSVPFLVLGLVWGLFFSPVDGLQGYSVKIMYIHVPSAYMATLIYGVMGVMGGGYLLTGSVFFDLLGRSLAPVGGVFALICLVSGSLWGKPTWGVYWVWDARLTSMLLLFLLYGGYVVLGYALGEGHRGGYSLAILGLVGALNLPVIKFSVDWWHTLHQPASLFRMGGPTIHEDLLRPLLTMMLAMSFFGVWLVSCRLEGYLLGRMNRLGTKEEEV
jgi:heme exporter protein C